MHEPPPHTGAYDCVNAHEPPPHSGAKHRVNVQRPPGHDVGVSQSSNAHSPVLHGVAEQGVGLGLFATRAAPPARAASTTRARRYGIVRVPLAYP